MKNPPLGRDGGDYLTDDNIARGMAMGGAYAAAALVKQALASYLARKKSQTGRGLAERIGYWLGSLWARSK